MSQNGRRLERVLREQAEAASVPPRLVATVSLEAGSIVWTSHIRDGGIQVAPGPTERPTVRIIAEPETLVDVLQGRRSGVEVFLEGKLRARGNLALALRLGSIFSPNGQPARWPVWRSVKARGIDTVFLEAGEGPDVVLLHGLGATNASLLTTMWDLARDHHVVAPDLPGFGDSAKPVRAYNAGFFAAWLAGFLDRLGIERTDVVGNSMGGRVAIELGLRHPHRVDRLVLLAPSPAFIKYREFVRLVRLLRPELALLPLRISHRNVVRSIRYMFSRPNRLPAAWFEAAADEFLRVFSTPRGRVAFFSAARQIYLEEPRGEHGFWDRLPSLRCPSLFVWGERDRLVPARFARHVEAALPAATSVILDDCGHVPQYELPDRTHQLMREFLRPAP